MLDYGDAYSRMRDDELARLASQWKTLTEPAQEALAAELEKRKLKAEIETIRRIDSEGPTPSGASTGGPSWGERLMFWLFICSGISAFLLRKVWLVVFDFNKPIQLGLYDIVVGISDCFLLWLIIWLVLRARRVRRETQC
jgi:hypothetical protein